MKRAPGGVGLGALHWARGCRRDCRRRRPGNKGRGKGMWEKRRGREDITTCIEKEMYVRMYVLTDLEGYFMVLCIVWPCLAFHKTSRLPCSIAPWIPFPAHYGGAPQPPKSSTTNVAAQDSVASLLLQCPRFLLSSEYTPSPSSQVLLQQSVALSAFC